MATPVQRLTLSVCQEKQRLADALLLAVRDLIALHGEEAAHLLRGGSGLPRLHLALWQARLRRNSAKNAYLVHTQAHGC